jgi:LysM repeat protein
VRVPTGGAASFAECVAKIPPSARVAFTRHVVRRGESLGSIARKYGVDIDEVVRMNNIANRNRIYVGTELVIPVPGKPTPASEGLADSGSEAAPTGEASTSRPTPTRPGGKAAWHTVRSGETLDGIAARYGASVQDLCAWNGISDPDRVRAGTRLRVGSAEPGRAAPASTEARHYEVKEGDTLSGIAAQCGVSVEDLQRWNSIEDPGQIKVGQDLVLQAAAEAWTVYVVRRGDTLGAIARRHGCDVEDLKAWNQISGNTIYPGQKLRIRR